MDEGAQQPGITYRVLDGSEAAASEDDLLALDREVYPNADHERRARQHKVWCRQPGFALAEARHGGYLVGYAAGMPLRPSTSWWRDLTAPLPPDLTTEHQGRTFALTELAVRASWRRQGIARELHDRMLAGRTEERATVTAPPNATAAQAAFRSWGWRKVARTRTEGEGDPVRDVLLTSLPPATAAGDPFPPGWERAQNASIDLRAPAGTKAAKVRRAIRATKRNDLVRGDRGGSDNRSGSSGEGAA